MLWCHLPNRRVAALRARTAAIYRTKEVPHTLPIFSRSPVIVDHHVSIRQTGRPVACAQCASRTAVLACAHGASVRRTAVLACAHGASVWRTAVLVCAHGASVRCTAVLACAHGASVWRTAVLACAHGASVWRTAVLACAQCASRTEAPSNGLRKYHRRERHDGTTHSHVDFLNLIIDITFTTVLEFGFMN